MHVELGGRVTNDVLVVLRVVAAKEGPEAVAEVAVDVAVFIQGAIVAQTITEGFTYALLNAVVCPIKPFIKRS